MRFAAAGVDYYPPKAWRHAAASFMAAHVGVPESAVGAVLGHSPKRTMNSWYVHPTPPVVRGYLAKVESAYGLNRTEVLLSVSGTNRGTEFPGAGRRTDRLNLK